MGAWVVPRSVEKKLKRFPIEEGRGWRHLGERHFAAARTAEGAFFLRIPTGAFDLKGAGMLTLQ